MVAALLGFFRIFGCSHKRTTFPISRLRGRSYVCCLECGREFDYDWRAMRIAREIEQQPLSLPVVSEEGRI